MKIKYIAALVLLAPVIAHAGTRDARINRHQDSQQDRIANGVASGELTHDEASQTRGDRRAIRQKERSYKSDGSLNKDERKDLRGDQRESSQNIYQQKHDDEKRPVPVQPQS